MTYEVHNAGLPVPQDWVPDREPRGPSFAGFALPTSNTTYTPNQFFDVCLPHYSRGVVRLVAYMIRKTLGWCDSHGNPVEDEVLVTYQELIDNAGISREMIRQSLDEAIAGKFIKCVREGRPDTAGKSAVTALFALRWDGGAEYIKDRKQFKGFFEGEGNRTYIPNQFFDLLIPQAALAVIKVVGSVIRFSIGFQVRRGSRRQHVALSYREIHNYTRIGSSSTLSTAIQKALESNYIVRVEDGFFDPKAGKESRAATYSLRWADSKAYELTGQKIEAGKTNRKISNRSENRSGTGQKIEARDRSENRSDIKIKHTNNTFKQQMPSTHDSQASVVAADEIHKKLRGAGYDEKTARLLAVKHSPTTIENQIRWLPKREAARNPLGMLRRAIEENWPEPMTAEVGLTQLSVGDGIVFAKHFFAGLGGNQSDPTAEPSTSESATAERFVQRLLRVWPDHGRVSTWGRVFGQMVHERCTTTRKPIASLVLALRLFGDEFFAQQSQSHRRAMAEARRADWEKHQINFKNEWLKYIAASEEDYRSARREDYERFETARNAEREKFHRSGFRSIADSVLSRFDTDEVRLLAFQKFFEGDVLDFAGWDQRMNPQKFPAEPVRS